MGSLSLPSSSISSKNIHQFRNLQSQLQHPACVAVVNHRNSGILPRALAKQSRSHTCLTVSVGALAGAGVNNSAKNGTFTVGDFMTRKADLHIVKPTTSVDEALELLVEKKITGLPVVDDNWILVGVVSDYDLLALDSISGGGQNNINMFPKIDSTWKTFNELQKLISKTYGKVVGDLMTPAPLVVRENTNLEDAARLLLETKYRRLPVVGSDGRLVGIITRGNVVSAALHIKRANENSSWSNH